MKAFMFSLLGICILGTIAYRWKGQEYGQTRRRHLG